ncbi:hypothetical protein ACM66B_004368 [Microbotryomycetes sp. NB124-2]
MAHQDDSHAARQDEQAVRLFPVSTLRRKPSVDPAPPAQAGDPTSPPHAQNSSTQSNALPGSSPSASTPRLSIAAHVSANNPPRRPSLEPWQPFEHDSTSISDIDGLPRTASPLTPVVSSAQTLSARLTRLHEYHYVQDDDKDGHFIVTGTQGTLLRCQDEPIHAPGAVQGHGVLIVLEDCIDGRFIVHQVSENSDAIIGIKSHDLLHSDTLCGIFSEEVLLDIADAIDDFDHLRRRKGDESLQLPVQFSIMMPRGQAHASLHRPEVDRRRCILELEMANDEQFPPTPPLDRADVDVDLIANAASTVSKEALDASTLSILQPLLKLKSWKARRQQSMAQNLDALSLMADINDQLSKCDELESFMTLVAALFRSVTGFTRSMVYQFDDDWNGRVVAEQVDPHAVVDLYRGLIWPASDIPPQARELYQLNKIRLLYDQSAKVAKMCCRTKEEAETPLDMTHAGLRAMSPIHVKYLENMGVKSSMSVSIILGNQLWGLVALHQLGQYPRRPSVPVRRLCKMIGDSVSVNLERILLRQKLSARQLVSFSLQDETPIVGQPQDLLSLFKADFGALVVGGQTKILGHVDDASELLALVDFLKAEQFEVAIHTRNIKKDFEQIEFEPGFKVLAGFLAIPLSGSEFVVFARKGMDEEVHWAGNPSANRKEGEETSLEPRSSFKLYKEVVRGRSRPWTDFELDQAHLLATVYGKFIAIWKQKESAESSSRLTSLLLENASHEARTPLNIIINHLEHALEAEIGSSDLKETLHRSAVASKSLLVAINDMLDLSKAGPTEHLTVNEPVNVRALLTDWTAVFRFEAIRKHLMFEFDEAAEPVPEVVVSDSSQLRKIVTNLVDNAVKCTDAGRVGVRFGVESKPRVPGFVEDDSRWFIEVRDTGPGITSRQLESLYRQLEEVESDDTEEEADLSIGLGLAVVARTVRVLGGQLRLESAPHVGTTATVFLPLIQQAQEPGSPRGRRQQEPFELDKMLRDLSKSHVDQPEAPIMANPFARVAAAADVLTPLPPSPAPILSPTQRKTPSPPRVKVGRSLSGPDTMTPSQQAIAPLLSRSVSLPAPPAPGSTPDVVVPPMRILVVEDDLVCRRILVKRLERDNHEVLTAQHGLEALDTIEDHDFDVILMDIQMPILDGIEATRQIRHRETMIACSDSPSTRMNGRLPVLAVSAHVEQGWKDVLMTSGFDGHADKPVDVSRLRTLLAGVLDPKVRHETLHHPGKWREGGWFHDAMGVLNA